MRPVGHTWHKLDKRALTFARDELRAGKRLARACVPLLSTVRPLAFLPADLPPERVYKFRGGSINAAERREDALPADVLWKFLRASNGERQRMLIFEDPYARPTDPFIASGRADTAVAFNGDDVYQVIPPEAAGDPWQLPVGEYPIIGVASSVGGPTPIADGDRLDEKVIRELADNSLAILIGAWDAENYLVLDRGLIASTNAW